MILLQFHNVSFVYPPDRVILNDLNFELQEGEFLVLTGKSGIGKSTLLKLIYFREFPTEGFIQFAEYNTAGFRTSDLPFLRRKIGIVFQSFELLKDRSVQDNISFIPEVTGKSSKEIKQKVNSVLKLVGLSHRRLSMPDELSGGEQQRVAIARAIINDPKLIIADEPTGNLDPETSAEILELFKRINAMGTAVIFATHNYELFKNFRGRVLKLTEKGISESTTVS
ncbi:MAG: Cell division ATP-binding protein FtsE [Ignavibacteriaceae bacterium]|nr:Cell division ATP-binding protein FtsE [Ignavibacteriaceae bacterium]MCK6612999.1 cell division ATP-binding protein FtsE [Ignavibacteriaceae bacterium]